MLRVHGDRDKITLKQEKCIIFSTKHNTKLIKPIDNTENICYNPISK